MKLAWAPPVQSRNPKQITGKSKSLMKRVSLSLMIDIENNEPAPSLVCIPAEETNMITGSFIRAHSSSNLHTLSQLAMSKAPA